MKGHEVQRVEDVIGKTIRFFEEELGEIEGQIVDRVPSNDRAVKVEWFDGKTTNVHLDSSSVIGIY